MDYLERMNAIDTHAREVQLGHISPAAEPRIEFVERVVKEMRRKHSELRGPLTFPSLKAVYRKENVLLYRAKISALGRAMPPFRGQAGVILRKPMPERGLLIPTALHELGHIKLHVFDRELDDRRRGELLDGLTPVFSLHDQMEAEADLFRDLILAAAPHSTTTNTTGASHETVCKEATREAEVDCIRAAERGGRKSIVESRLRHQEPGH